MNSVGGFELSIYRPCQKSFDFLFLTIGIKLSYKICPLRVSQKRGSRYTDSPYIETLVSNDQFRDSNIVVVADRGSLFDCSLDPPTAVLFYVTARA